MTESTATSVVRSAGRQTAPPKSAAPLVYESELGINITVAGDIRDVRTLKNALERFIRLLRKALAAGITDASSLTDLLAAVAEIKRLKKATEEATDRVQRVLGERSAEPTAALRTPPVPDPPSPG